MRPLQKPIPCTGPAISRRRMLQIGFSGSLGLGLPDLLRADTAASSGQTKTADACIVVFLNGGPSHLDMWDMKPDAPAEIRGEFKPIATSVTGVRMSEHLPRMAKLMHHAAVIRSMHHRVNNAHAAAVYCGLTGHDRGEIGGGARPTDHPAMGSVLGIQRPPEKPTVPYVMLPYITKEGAGGPPQPGFYGGWLGRGCDPFIVLRDPNAANFDLPELGGSRDVPPQRLRGRASLLRSLQSRGDRSSVAADMTVFQRKAMDLLNSTTTRQAFRIDQEPDRVRESYGRNIYGQSVLLARRLVEAGTRLVCVSWAPDANATWDTHGGNFKKLKGNLLPQLDSAIASLLGDLSVRGMLGRTVVAVMGEFGRTPKINKNQAGRDHWNFCYGLMLAGGGIKGGYVHGSSDRIGAFPRTQPVTPADVVATIYQCLGISSDLELRDNLGRPFTLVPWGKPIAELLA